MKQNIRSCELLSLSSFFIFFMFAGNAEKGLEHKQWDAIFVAYDASGG